MKASTTMSLARMVMTGKAVLGCSVSRSWTRFQAGSTYVVSSYSSSLSRFFSSNGVDPSVARLVAVMRNNPAVLAMMEPLLPPQLRGNREALKDLLSDPKFAEQMSEMMAKTGMSIPSHILDAMEHGGMERRMADLGFTGNELMAKFASHPLLMQKLTSKPHLMKAVTEVLENPSNISKYLDDQEATEVIYKVKEILQPKSSGGLQGPLAQAVKEANQSQGEDTAPPSSSAHAQGAELSTPSTSAPDTHSHPATSTTTTTSTTAPVGERIQMPPPPPLTGSASFDGGRPLGRAAATSSDPEMAVIMAQQHLLESVSPRVQEAMRGIAERPWTLLYHVFRLDFEVMNTIMALQRVAREAEAAAKAKK